MFGGKPVPAVGVSLGIERVYAIMEQQIKDDKDKVMMDNACFEHGDFSFVFFVIAW